MADSAHTAKQKSVADKRNQPRPPVTQGVETAGSASVRAAEVPSGQEGIGNPQFDAKLDDTLAPDKTRGYGLQSPDQRAGAEDHHAAKGDARDSGYGAAPLRKARYRDGTSGTYGQGEKNAGRS